MSLSPELSYKGAMWMLMMLLAASAQEGLAPEPQPELVPLVRHADIVAVVEVLTVANVPEGGGHHTAATFQVIEVLRGRAEGTISARTGVAFKADPGMTRLGLVAGYKLVVFLDDQHNILEGGVFYLEAGYGWRPKRPGLFINPRADHDWVDELDPTKDYTLWTLEDIRAAADRPRAFRRQKRRESAR